MPAFYSFIADRLKFAKAVPPRSSPLIDANRILMVIRRGFNESFGG